MARKNGLLPWGRASPGKTKPYSSNESHNSNATELDSSSEYNETHDEQDAEEYETETPPELRSDQVLSDHEESTAPRKRQKLPSKIIIHTFGDSLLTNSGGQSKKANAKATQKTTRNSRPMSNRLPFSFIDLIL